MSQPLQATFKQEAIDEYQVKMATEISPQTTSSSAPETAVDSANGIPKTVLKPRLYLEPLTTEKHLEAFHELWTYEETLIWLYVFYFPVIFILSHPLKPTRY